MSTLGKWRYACLGLLVGLSFVACGTVPVDDQRNDRRLVPPRGVIRGTVTYQGPRPCSKDGHIVGNAVISVFDRRNPPPPVGVATRPVNFVAVQGDALFANEPRSVGPELSCPPENERVTASATFAIAPLEGASYVVTAFYDRRGRFFPSFAFRNQPEAGDLSGGHLDLEDAARNTSEEARRPVLLPVDVGVPSPAPAGEIPDFTIDERGFVADNVPVTIGSVVPFLRPVFRPQAIDRDTGRITSEASDLPPPLTSDANPTGDPLAVPLVAVPQDLEVLAPPASAADVPLAAWQRSFPTVRLAWAVEGAETESATRPTPFGLTLPPAPPQGSGGILVWGRGQAIAEDPRLQELWPQITFVKLADDPTRTFDPQSLVVQGTPEETNVTGQPRKPIVVLTGIPLLGDSARAAVDGPVPTAPTTSALRDHLTVLLRPAALCFDPRRVDLGALYVTPHLVGRSADAAEAGEKPLFDQEAVLSTGRVREVRRGCLPAGRYAMAVTYPNGQSWTVPNEMGGCARAEGATAIGPTPTTCTTKPRDVVLSQGARGVVEIVAPAGGDAACAEAPVPRECLFL